MLCVLQYPLHVLPPGYHVFTPPSCSTLLVQVISDVLQTWRSESSTSHIKLMVWLMLIGWWTMSNPQTIDVINSNGSLDQEMKATTLQGHTHTLMVASIFHMWQPQCQQYLSFWLITATLVYLHFLAQYAVTMWTQWLMQHFLDMCCSPHQLLNCYLHNIYWHMLTITDCGISLSTWQAIHLLVGMIIHLTQTDLSWWHWQCIGAMLFHM